MPGVRVVTTIHDTCFFSEPRFSLGRWVHTGQLWSACLRASRLICISHATHRALAEWSPTVGRQAAVIHNGFEGSTIPRNEAVEAMRQLDASLVPQHYLLWVGIPSPRKNPGLLFEIFSAHQRRFPGHKYVIVTPKEFHSQIRTMAKWAGVETAVRVYSVDNATRDALYRCALAFIFPSSCEGFGYPALEAMVQGCPAICLEGTAMQELSGGVIPLAPELTTAAFMDTLSAWVMLPDADREEVKGRLIERSANFSSRIMAAKTLAILREAGKL
jgi:glycosyltransferase involved in cell wall biosynthesis